MLRHQVAFILLFTSKFTVLINHICTGRGAISQLVVATEGPGFESRSGQFLYGYVAVIIN